MAFDPDHPRRSVYLVGPLRGAEASVGTQRDTPMSACTTACIAETLAQSASIE
jgi:hypothetical protein